MIDNIKHALMIIAVIAAIAFGYEWVQEHDARVKAEAESKIQQTKADDAAIRIKIRDDAFNDTVKNFMDALKDVKTPAQAEQRFEQQQKSATPLLNIPAPVTEYKTPADAPKVGDLVVPKADILPIFQQLNECKIAQAGLSKCDLDKKDLITQRDAFKAQADEWQKAAKGGSKLHRTFSTLGKLGAGVVVGYGLRAATHR